MEKYLALATAARVAATLRAQAITLDRLGDRARKGHDVNPGVLAREMATNIKTLNKELARA